MGKNPLSQGVVTANFTGTGPAPRALVHSRARELAEISGRPPHLLSPADYAQARRELEGAPDLDPQETQLTALPETKRWDPVPGSEGRQAPESPDEDDDDEGHNESAQLVAAGVNEAAHDQMLQAARAAAAAEKSDRDRS